MNVGRLAPIYPATAGLSQRMPRRLVRAALDATQHLVQETSPGSIRPGQRLVGLRAAPPHLHFPED